MRKLSTFADTMCKNAQMENWDDIRYFLAVARGGNVTIAAAELGVNHSTVSRRIGTLERRLGVRLFDRLPSGYALTPSAGKMLGDAQRVESDIVAISRRLASRDMRLTGTLRMTAPEGIVSIVLMPHIATFSELHPEIEIQITATSDIKSLNNREADLAIRATNQPPEGLVGRKLTGQGLAKYASRAYLDARGVAPGAIAATVKDNSRGHAWIGLIGDKIVPNWVKAHYPDARCAARLDTVYTLYGAAKAGLGIAELPCRLGNADPDLVRVAPLETAPHRDIWILYHRDMRHTARLRALADFLTKIVVAERRLFEE